MSRMTLPATLLATLSLSFSSQAFSASDPHWSYSGNHGPEHWGTLSSEFATCGSGKNQSPIDLTDTVKGELAALRMDYASAGEEVINNGHTIKIPYAGENTLTLDDRTFHLKQVHFHTPSEYTIEGHRYPMVAHLVHADSEGNLAVTAVMFEKGKKNSGLAEAWTQLPQQAGERNTLANGLSAEALLPEDQDYYRLNGSLTTPPCTEGVRWLVMKTPVQVSDDQLTAMENAIGHANNRPLQPVNARLVVE